MTRIVTMRLLFAYFLCCLLLPVNSSNENCQSLCEGKSNYHSISIGESCFFRFDGVEKSWNDTKHFCTEQNMTMLQLPKNANDSFMEELWKFANATGETEAWLGGEAVDLESWTFVNGSPLNMTKTSPDFIKFNVSDSSIHHKCGVVNATKHVRLQKCSEEFSFICRTEGRHNLSGSKAKNWFDARANCQENGGDLFYAKEDESVRELLKTITPMKKDEKYFIGLIHQSWEWQDGTEIRNSNWNNQEPDLYKCLMLKDGKLDADPCNWTSQVICQKPPPREQQKSTSGSPKEEQNEVAETKSGFNPKMTMGHFAAIISIFTVPLLLLWMIITLILIMAWRMKGPKKEVPSLEELANQGVYCEVVVSKKKTPGFKGKTKDVSKGKADRSGGEMSMPFTRHSFDDMMVIENHLYGTSENLAVDDKSRATLSKGVDEIIAGEGTRMNSNFVGTSGDVAFEGRQSTTYEPVGRGNAIEADNKTLVDCHPDGTSENAAVEGRLSTTYEPVGRDNTIAADNMTLMDCHPDGRSRDVAVEGRHGAIYEPVGRDNAIAADNMTLVDCHRDGTSENVDGRHNATHEMISDEMTLVDNHLYGASGDDAPRKKCRPTDVIALKPLMPEGGAREVTTDRMTPVNNHLRGKFRVVSQKGGLSTTYDDVALVW